MRETEPMRKEKPRDLSPAQPTFREIAREEFWFVAKAYFAPVYGTYLVWKQLLRLKENVDRKALGVAAPPAPSQPAE